jgi:predicted N-acetyltransferase YhbS
MFRLVRETQNDIWEVEALYDLCFAPGREALSSYRFREGVEPVAALCKTARDADGILGGAIRFWEVRIGGHSALLLGPVAVHPTCQGEGLGGMLIRDAQENAKALGWSRIILVGDAPYYQRYGFTRLENVQMPAPTNPDRVLGWGDWAGLAGLVTRNTPLSSFSAAST